MSTTKGKAVSQKTASQLILYGYACMNKSLQTSFSCSTRCTSSLSYGGNVFNGVIAFQNKNLKKSKQVQENSPVILENTCNIEKSIIKQDVWLWFYDIFSYRFTLYSAFCCNNLNSLFCFFQKKIIKIPKNLLYPRPKPLEVVSLSGNPTQPKHSQKHYRQIGYLIPASLLCMLWFQQQLHHNPFRLDQIAFLLI